MGEAEQRAAVVAAARLWRGTPWHHNARVMGAGIDCANIICDAFEKAGLIQHIEPVYARQWGLHQDRELFIEWIEKSGGHEIDRSSVKVGDIATFKFGRTFFHGAIFTDSVTVIHADMRMGVIEEPISQNMRLQTRMDSGRARFFSLW
jgi:cell wall-associated NlpC family hydrolase